MEDVFFNGGFLLIGAAMVFFMQAGFAMVESGFTRAKNAANIIMKNLMDFSLGTVVFALLGYQLLVGTSIGGFVGTPNLSIFTDFSSFDFADFVFNMVFCATAATIVSGAMAERTKFSSYIIYSIVLSAVIYPIQAGWVWNENGWLTTLGANGFIDFAGSSAIHMLGGIAAFIGAAVLGARIGKYKIDKATGKKTSRAIPGHSLVVGALGVFILWFGWYGFNGAAALDFNELGIIFLNTTIAPAMAATVTMTYTWLKGGSPDVSMTLNGALGGLVGITAGCANVNALGAFIIGAVAGLLIPVSVELIDKKLHVDDPVGAVAVHGVCGAWGALAVGLFAIDGIGLFYGGGFSQLGVQAVGVASIAAWTIVTMVIVFVGIKKTVGLRASADEEIAGLDAAEHGMTASSYADFIPATSYNENAKAKTVKTAVTVPYEQSVSVSDTSTGTKLTKVTIITKPNKFELLRQVFDQIGITGITVTNVMGYGLQRGHTHTYRGVALETPLIQKIQIDVVVSKVPVDLLVENVRTALYTGNIGDGKIFVYDVEDVIRVRTSETGFDALQDSEVGDD
ncbi:MAG: ammonium transporter [Lachnospiraceae bacterium]|nr:ammonium transporter [Lachnospiraceae bacterium]